MEYAFRGSAEVLKVGLLWVGGKVSKIEKT